MIRLDYSLFEWIVTMARCMKLSEIFKKPLFIERDEGVVAVEFAMVALPFILTIISVLEAGLFFYKATLLDTAAYDASRIVRTGEISTMGDAETAFRAILCDRVVLVACDDIVVEMLDYNDFASAVDDPPTYDDDDNLVSSGFSAGGANNTMVGRVAYEFSFMTPLIGTLITGSPSTSVTLTSTVIFRNEPY